MIKGGKDSALRVLIGTRTWDLQVVTPVPQPLCHSRGTGLSSSSDFLLSNSLGTI